MAIHTFERILWKSRQNFWMQLFTIFCRIALAAGFLPSGFVKVNGERFTDLANNHPMGHYLEALFHTGWYYPFIGVMQMTAAVLLLIPRTALLGAMIYFPIILNITLLSLSVRFDGSLISSPLMLLANVYLLCWDWNKLKFIFAKNLSTSFGDLPVRENRTKNFPIRFAGFSFLLIVLIGFTVTHMYEVMPRNHIKDCNSQFNPDSYRDNRTQAGSTFCDCIHKEGNSLSQCLEEYELAEDDI